MRARLVVVIDEMERPSLDAARFVDDLGEDFEAVAVALAEESAAAGQRQDDMDVVGLGGTHRSRDAGRKRKGKRQRRCVLSHGNSSLAGD